MGLVAIKCDDQGERENLRELVKLFCSFGNVELDKDKDIGLIGVKQAALTKLPPGLIALEQFQERIFRSLRGLNLG